MITAKLVGQFGNQACGYVMAKILALHTGQCYTPPPYFVTKSGEPVKWQNDDPLLRMEPTPGRELVDEHNPQIISVAHWFDIGALDVNKPIHIRFGYFQRYEMLRQYKTLIRTDWLRLRKPFHELSDDTVAMHVRRTDYVPSESNTLNRAVQGYYTGIDEYLNCLSKLNVGRVVIVTDDYKDRFCIELGEAILKNTTKPVYFADEWGYGTWDTDFLLLASAEQVVLSQSTYSWWAAFLGRAKKVVCSVPPGSLWHNGICNRQLPHLYVDDEPERWLWLTD